MGSSPIPVIYGTMNNKDLCPPYNLEKFANKCQCPAITDACVGYSEFYDAFFCTVCRHWFSPKCGALDCSTCSERPDTVPIARENHHWECGFSYALYNRE